MEYKVIRAIQGPEDLQNQINGAVEDGWILHSWYPSGKYGDYLTAVLLRETPKREARYTEVA